MASTPWIKPNAPSASCCAGAVVPPAKLPRITGQCRHTRACRGPDFDGRPHCHARPRTRQPLQRLHGGMSWAAKEEQICFPCTADYRPQICRSVHIPARDPVLFLERSLTVVLGAFSGVAVCIPLTLEGRRASHRPLSGQQATAIYRESYSH